MSLERLRNVVTSEIRDVETNSSEYVELINQVYDHQGAARPKWEITGQHHVMRLDDGDIEETDLGYAYKPIPGAEVGFDEIGPEPHPERALSPGEVDMGIESHEQKMEGLPMTRTEGHLSGVEKIPEVPVDERLERGMEAAGSEGKKSRRQSNGRGKSSGDSGSGSGDSGSGSSGSSQSARGPGQSGQAAAGSSGGGNS